MMARAMTSASGGGAANGQARGPWVMVFLVMGMASLIAAILLPFLGLPALLAGLVVWPVAGGAAMRIWRIDHPGERARDAVGLRVRLAIGGLPAVIGGLLTTAVLEALDQPGVVSVVVGIGAALVVFGAIGWFVRWSEQRRRGERLPMGTPVDRGPGVRRDR